jgi:hypothetical protein
MNISFAFKPATGAVRVYTVFLFAALLSVISLRAASKTWASTGSTNWSTGSNWSPSGVPGVNDTVFFNTGSVNCILPASAFSIQRIYLNGSYGGSVTLGAGAMTVSNATGGFTQSSGTFNGVSGGTLTVTGPFALSGGTVNALGATININGAFTQSGGTLNLNTSTVNFAANVTFNNSSLTFDAGTSLVQVSKTCSLSVSNEPVISFYRFGLNQTAATAIYTISSTGSSTIRVTEEMIFGGNKAMQLNNDSITILGHLTVTNQFANSTGGTGVLYFMGSTDCNFTGDVSDYVCGLPKVVVNKPGATITATKKLTFAKGLIVSAGTLVCDNTTDFCFINSQTITVSDDVNDVQFSVGTYTITTPLNAKGNFRSRGSTGNVTINGTVNVEKDVTINNGFATTNAGSGKLVFTGGNEQKIIGNTINGNGKLCSVEIDKTAGSVSLVNIVSVMGSWTVINGSVSADGSSAIWFTQLSGGAATNIDMRNVSGDLQVFASFGVASGTITLTDDLNLTANLAILSGATLNSNNKNISVGSNWTNSGGTFTAGTGSVTFTGSGNKAITRTVSGAASTETFTNLAFNRESGRITLGSIVQVNTSMTLTKGKIVSATGKHLSFADNATCTGGGDGAYVCGPVRKTGNDAFVFPLGDTLLVDSVAWHPLGISAPGAAGDVFEGMYRAVNQTSGTVKADNLEAISSSENWTLNRLVGSSSVTATLSWNFNINNSGVLADQVVSNWNGSQWIDLGASSIVSSNYTGLITASTPVTFISQSANLIIAIKKTDHPYALLKDQLDGGYYQAINGRLFFRFDEEYNPNGPLQFTIYNQQNQVVTTTQQLPVALQPIEVYGDNRYKINTIHCLISPTGALPNGIYILEVKNEKGEKWYLRFKQSSTIVMSNCSSSPNPQ